MVKGGKSKWPDMVTLWEHLASLTSEQREVEVEGLDDDTKEKLEAFLEATRNDSPILKKTFIFASSYSVWGSCSPHLCVGFLFLAASAASASYVASGIILTLITLTSSHSQLALSHLSHSHHLAERVACARWRWPCASSGWRCH